MKFFKCRHKWNYIETIDYKKERIMRFYCHKCLLESFKWCDDDFEGLFKQLKELKKYKDWSKKREGRMKKNDN